MENVAHAPGPWECEKSPGIAAGTHEWHVYANAAKPGGRLPAVCDTEANARLIAAAPELLELLYRALPFVEDAEGDAAYKAGFVRKLVRDIGAALQKATGHA